uniref:Uncharacterized protein n=1 Tax=Solanum lycopersicum TaxID=4081 RepID=K4C0G6_SOLLC
MDTARHVISCEKMDQGDAESSKSEVRDKVNPNVSKKEDYGSNKKDEGDQEEKSKGHMIIFEEPMPLQMEEPLSEKEIEDRATIWCSLMFLNSAGGLEQLSRDVKK